MVRLSELVTRLGGELIQRVEFGWAGDPQLTDVALDSRLVGPGALFCALEGNAEDGRRFTPSALAAGAEAVLTAGLSTELGSGFVAGSRGRDLCRGLWLHPDARRAAGLAADLIWGQPSRALAVIGITGTNGKTSVAYMLRELLLRAGKKPSMFGTVEYSVWGEEPVAATTTTPSAPFLHAALGRAQQHGGETAVLEVSSHAIDQERTAGIDFDVCVFTNLTRDHLDYHGSLDAYGATKLRLFRALGPGKSAVINIDDPHGEAFARAAREGGARVVTYSIGSRADLVASRWESGPDGIRLFLQGMGIDQTGFTLPLTGRHNIENALAAAAVMLLLDASPSTLVEGLASISPAPGRLEPVDPRGEVARGFRVLVDFAHTPSALAGALAAAREALGPGGRLLAVFGCGGDRDRGKRPEMGAAVKAGATIAYLTSDNPRSEDPEAILDAVEAGFEAAAGDARLVREVDRRAAIALALTEARPGDVVLVAGKGHETVQILGNERRAFDDRLVVQELLS